MTNDDDESTLPRLISTVYNVVEIHRPRQMATSGKIERQIDSRDPRFTGSMVRTGHMGNTIV